MSTMQPGFRWRSIALPALLPTLLFSIGEGAVIPVIPVVAERLGADIATAGLVAGMILVGNLVGDLPGGAIVSRVGERAAMIGASAVSIAGLAVAIIATAPWMLALGILLVGLATTVFALARHAFMTSFVPISHRARALSTLGGTFRLGYFLGPFLTAGVIQLAGAASAAFWIHLVCCVLAAAVLIALPDPAASFGVSRASRAARTGEVEVVPPRAGLFRTLRDRRQVLLTLGLGSALLAALRASRSVILPLWAVSIDLDATTTALVIGAAGAVDVSLFYAGGWIMDRFGRLWTAVPAAIGLALGHLVLSLTHELDARVAWFVGVAFWLSLANGISSGTLMTLGADLADRRDPAPFLGAWRFQNDAGGAVVPLAIAGITAAVSLPLAAAAVGAVGFAGAVLLRVYIPRSSPVSRASPRPSRRPRSGGTRTGP
ncbi:MFS transporter [Homoserinibacter sp. YIM 151385]|uniref:MFS transporter n=1 Tax=Homoserinibacter sp. YIM 151385 TaxID=2985506 RepID=UPI0022F09DE0|nr:MFS transporter [Homoserinibacter sp. YIM 151385]WBU38205.1 MFS transporter [Homoserinibacter sp. YIM 151385]